MTTYTQQQMIALGGSEWRHPGTGELRIYVNEWPGMIGLEVERYKSGNICSATLDGERISNARAGEIITAVRKVWWSEADGKIHMTSGYPNRYTGEVPGWIRDAIAQAVVALPTDAPQNGEPAAAKGETP